MTTGTPILSGKPSSRSAAGRAGSAWLGGTRLGLVVMALVVGAGAGVGAAGFRWLVFGATWLTTGHTQFGQQGHAASLHLPWLGIWFVLLVPVIGGLIYGPLVQRFAPEARGHGVPEVMLAVAENGGRIRPPVVAVKAFASAITIGVGGSVGREGPIVQIGSALASTLGQWVHMSESRLRIIVACGAAGGIAATFNAPLTGLFFGFEIVLREFSLDALFATSLSAVTGVVISRAFFGSAPFLAGIPHGLAVANDGTYLLIVLLAVLAGVIGIAFKTVLYWLEDYVDRLWAGRPEWARPAVGGIALGLLLLAIPQMYGVGYPVMDSVISGHVVIGLVLVFLVGKIAATSLTLSIGGSGGVFAPSLFIGAMAGMAFGEGVHGLFGASIGPPALYAVVAMGGVFGAAAQAPLTAIASVVEMTGNYALTVPVMLTCAIAAAVSKRLSYGSVYTTKLLRRGIDIERPKPTGVLHALTVSQIMQPIPATNGQAKLLTAEERERSNATWSQTPSGQVTSSGEPQELFEDETLEQALRQLTLFGHSGLPIISQDRQHVEGWITSQNILDALARTIERSSDAMQHGATAADVGFDHPQAEAHQPTNPLHGYEVLEIDVDESSRALGSRPQDSLWPPGTVVVAVDREGADAHADPVLRTGDRITVLSPTTGDHTGEEPETTETAITPGRS